LGTSDYSNFVHADPDKVNSRADELLEYVFVNDDGMFSATDGTLFFSGTETGIISETK